MSQCPPNPEGPQHQGGGGPSPAVSPCPCHIAGMLWAEGQGRNPCLWDIAFIALKLHQGPELLFMGGWWKSMTVFPPTSFKVPSEHAVTTSAWAMKFSVPSQHLCA